jgi:hypothetical protein
MALPADIQAIAAMIRANTDRRRTDGVDAPGLLTAHDLRAARAIFRGYLNTFPITVADMDDHPNAGKD